MVYIVILYPAHLLVTTWSFCNSIHPSGFEQLLGTRAKIVLFSCDTPVFLNTFSVQGNTVMLLLLVLLAYFNVIIIIDIEIG